MAIGGIETGQELLSGYSKTKIKTKPKGNKTRQKINGWPDVEKFEFLCVGIGK